MPAPSRHTVNDFKRKLKEQLTSSYQFLEITRQESSSGTGSGTSSSAMDSYFFGGRWSAFATLNTERKNHFLPNDSFCSSHLAIGAKFSANGSFLSSQWRWRGAWTVKQQNNLKSYFQVPFIIHRPRRNRWVLGLIRILRYHCCEKVYKFKIIKNINLINFYESYTSLATSNFSLSARSTTFCSNGCV